MSVRIIDVRAKKPTLGEALAFMRAGRSPDPEVVAAASRGIDLVYSVSSPRACYVKCALELLGGGKIRLGALEFTSKSLEERLSGCFEAYIFAATVGTEVDRIIRAESQRSGLSGLCADAAGSAAVESVCDAVNSEIIEICKREGKLTRTRFSAGYGDMSLEYQREICELLDTKKHIGVALGEGVMMMPTKSVTAIIGVY